MERFICENVFVPLRSAPAHKSEMLSQVLFGEKYTVVDQSGTWLKIRIDFDNCQGWIDTNHLQYVADEGSTDRYVLNRSLLCHKSDNTKLVLEAGSEICNPDFEGKSFKAGQNVYHAASDFSKQYISGEGNAEDIAMKFINSPYLWGGRIPSGIDCSGLVQLVYKIMGIPIARYAAEQSEEGSVIEFIDEARPGDLAFFTNERGKVGHVGMIISKGLIIHASGRVRIDPIDHQGIFKREINGYSHNLRTIRRITGNTQEM
jgi:gamma-D-glutamyl-L-lysine dipeptidyl-peptidase